MSRLFSVVGLIPRVVLVILMTLMLLDMMLGVFFRYVVGQALYWSEEVGTLCLVWLTLIGSAIGVTRDYHFSITMLPDHLQPGKRRILRIVIAMLIMLFGLVLAPYGLDLSISNSTSVTPGLGINLAFQYASAFVGGVMIACYALILAVETIHGRNAS